MEEEMYEKTRLNDEKKRKRAEEFIRRFRAKATLASRVQSRVKALEKRTKLEKLEQAKDLDFSFQSKPFNGKPVMHVKDLAFGYEPSSPLFSDLSFSVGPYDRVCVVGKNGKGKTTLLRTLAGQIEPQAGEIQRNSTVVTAYYAQANADALIEEKTVVEEIQSANPDIDQQRARNIAGMMMFEGDDALKRVRVLSGGEKNRLMLGRIIATPVNLLLLDEPTNHLDMESCDALLEAIDDFEGAVVMVTHNEMLLHGLAERLIVFQGGGAKAFEGSYQRFLDDRGWDEEKAAAADDGEESAGGRRAGRKELRKLRAEIARERGAALRPLEKRISELEGSIVDAETELARLYEDMESASEHCDGGAIADLSQKIHARRKDIETCFKLLEAVNLKYEARKAPFDLRMKDLEED